MERGGMVRLMPDGNRWKRAGWDEMGRDGTGWDGMERDGTGWDGTGRDGTGRDGTGWDRIGQDGMEEREASGSSCSWCTCITIARLPIVTATVIGAHVSATVVRTGAAGYSARLHGRTTRPERPVNGKAVGHPPHL